MNIIHFACGHTYESTNPPILKKDGSLERILTYGPGIKGPHKERNCLFGCPCKVKDSGRKQFRAWVGKTEEEVDAQGNEPVLVVSCQPTHCTTSNDTKTEK